MNHRNKIVWLIEKVKSGATIDEISSMVASDFTPSPNAELVSNIYKNGFRWEDIIIQYPESVQLCIEHYTSNGVIIATEYDTDNKFITMLMTTGIYYNPYELRHFFDKYNVFLSIMSYPDGFLINIQGNHSKFMSPKFAGRIESEQHAIRCAFYCLEENIKGKTLNEE